jgi:hypothetical protein
MRFGMRILTLSAAILALSCQAQVKLPLNVPKAAAALLPKATTALTETEVANGLKEALVAGVQKGSSVLGSAGGFAQSEVYRLALPPEVADIEAKINANPLLRAALMPKIQELKEKLNEGAERAASKSFPIFKQAVVGMSLRDALGILRGGEGSATRYLRNETERPLQDAFRPAVQSALDEVEIARYWEPLTNAINQNKRILGRTEEIQTDLVAYVNQKATEALFSEIAKEEDRIRRDPVRRTSELLRKVFGSL